MKRSQLTKKQITELLHNDSEDVKEEIETSMSFSKAFDKVRNGLAVGMRLPKWSEDVVIKIQVPDEHSKMTAPYFYVQSRFGNVPWMPTQIEIFSDKWNLVE